MIPEERMEPALRSLLLVAGTDHEAVRALDLPIDLLAVRPGDSGPEEPGGASFRPELLTAETIGAIAVSAEGCGEAEALRSLWQERTGMPPPPLVDLSELEGPAARRDRALDSLARLFRDHAATATLRAAEALETLTALRLAHERSLRLEQTMRNFIAGELGTRRWLGQANGPIPPERGGPLTLPAGGVLTQTLPASSRGLTDVGLFLPDQDMPQAGRLMAELTLAETGETAAAWIIEAEALTTGWLRLSLLEALDDDDQSPHLRLNWKADRALQIGGGVFHPDPAFCARIGGRTEERILAHRIWKHVPGSRPPMPADGHWQDGALPERFYIEPEQLSAAADGVDATFFEGSGALQVHPRPEKISLARLPGAVRPGVRAVRATIAGRHSQGPRVEYALAAVPHRPARDVANLVTESERARRISDWTELAADREDWLELILPGPAEQPLDLCLMTRLAPGAHPAYGWATFRDLWLAT